MGVSLLGVNKGNSEINWFFWRNLLKVACHYGWVPKGAYYDMHKTSNKTIGLAESYFYNDGQLVCSSDVQDLASALKKAYSDIPKEKINYDSDCQDSLIIFSGHVSRRWLLHFICFCNANSSHGFRIF